VVDKSNPWRVKVQAMEDNGQPRCPAIDVSRIGAEIPLWRTVAWIMGLTGTAFLALALGLWAGWLKPSSPLGAGPLAGLLIVAVSLFVGATACYAVRKGRRVFWGLLGLGIFAGPIAVARLDRRCWHCRRTAAPGERTCPCGAPV
jgi:hypothetical protein